MQAVRVHAYGGPEAMVVDDLPLPQPGPNEVLVRVAVAGVNFYDTQLRGGLTKRALPVALGLEGAGVVEAVGADAGYVPGTRVAWAQSPGSYATHALVPVSRLVTLPAAVSFEDAAAVLFQGMTAHHLACSTYELGPGDAALVHSAAGGVGGLLCQIAVLRGARVIAAVSTDAKAAVAIAAGASDAIVYGRDDVAATAKRLTGGRGVDVVYDAVGKETFEGSLGALRPRGLLAIYGEASGDVPPLDVRRLSAAGSVYVTRTALSSYVATRAEFVERADALLDWLADGKLRVHIHDIIPLERAAEAHRALESRASTGKVLLDCG